MLILGASFRPDARIYIYHAHIHFQTADLEAAHALKETMQEIFQGEDRYYFGRTHPKSVGPHPYGSFELVFSRPDYAEVLTWFQLHRPDSMSIFIHPLTLEVVSCTPPACCLDCSSSQSCTASPQPAWRHKERI